MNQDNTFQLPPISVRLSQSQIEGFLAMYLSRHGSWSFESPADVLAAIESSILYYGFSSLEVASGFFEEGQYEQALTFVPQILEEVNLPDKLSIME